MSTSLLDRVASSASDNDLEDFFENGSVALHLVNADGIILRANRAELELLGYAREEYVGRPIADFHADPEVIADILSMTSPLSSGRPFQLTAAKRDFGVGQTGSLTQAADLAANVSHLPLGLS